MSEDFGRDIGATERMVREWQEGAADKAEKFGRMQQRVQQITVTETTRDGAIQVTVSANGMLTDLRLSDQANNRPMPKLGAEIMRTIQTAQSKIPDLMQQAVEETVGLQDAAAQHVISQARKTFPEPPAEAPVQSNPPASGGSGASSYTPPRRRSGPESDWDDDFGNDSFLR